MKLEILAEGFVSRRQPGTATAVASGPRCALLPPGTIVCSFMVQAALGRNDFQPMIVHSSDNGVSWSEPRPIWPELAARYAIFGSVSAARDGELCYFGQRTPIDVPGESFWSDATQGLKQNELFWARSSNGGLAWEPFRPIPMPSPGSAEAPGAMCVTRQGGLVCCYAPYNTFDPALAVKRNQITCLSSVDRGQSWRHAAMLLFPEEQASGAEAWVVELSDGRLLGAGWHIVPGSDRPNAWALSSDGGKTWGPTRSCGIMGQSVGLAPLPDGRALMVYNQRKFGDVGVWLAVVNPTDSDYDIVLNQRIWIPEIVAQKEGSTDHKNWTDFAFGEPSIVRLPNGDILVTLWSMQPSGYGIRYVKLRLL